MILLKKVRLIHWYGFRHITAPIGFFTLIAGKNGNGKSVLLDAIRYAAYGDTVFNKSSDSKSARTLLSYTRGLLDATAKTYMRPAETVPNVYSHIALEYYDTVMQKKFILGIIIETNVTNNYQTYRYVMDNRGLDEVEHVCQENRTLRPYNGSGFQKKYGVVLMNREQGLLKFMQMTGLKLNLSQTVTYLRKLRGIMTYDPEAKIDRFIKDSVLEDKKVDFSKLIEAKENIGRLTETFTRIQEELEELNKILDEYDGYESSKNRLLIDDIKIVYKKILDLTQSLEQLQRKTVTAENRKNQIGRELQKISVQETELEKKLREVTVSLEQMDCLKPIRLEEEHLTSLKKEKESLSAEKLRLEEFQRITSELLSLLSLRGRKINSQPVLASLTGTDYRTVEKEQAAAELKQAVSDEYELLIHELSRLERQFDEIAEGMDTQSTILESCKKNRNAYHEIQVYVNLKNEINREFEKRGIKSEAKFACEYVLALEDEAWRNAIEAFLGHRRYSILVDPDYYDIADEILNRSSNKYAHLFNTKLLMKKTVEPESDSVVQFLTIKNPVAKKYFDYQLGRMKAVPLDEVKNHENAMSKEGRVSVSMDSYYLQFDRLKYYYLGQEIFELNRIRAEREIEKLRERKTMLLDQKKELEQQKNQLNSSRDYFKEYRYDAFSHYQEVCTLIRESEQILERLKAAQNENREYMELSQMKQHLESQFTELRTLRDSRYSENSMLSSAITNYGRQTEEHTTALSEAEQRFKEYQLTEYTAVQKATEAYDKFLANGSKGIGGLIAPDSRRRFRDIVSRHEKDLLMLQAEYNGKRKEENKLPTGLDCRKEYENRKAGIWMDDLQEVQQKLTDQTIRYEEIFKNEFVLTILKSCSKAMEDLKLINTELAKLKFSTHYQFDVHLLGDSSDFAKVIRYAKYLDEREQFGGDGRQMILGAFSSYTAEETEQMEKEIKAIINGIISKNNVETIEKFADYRNYMTYEILIRNETFQNAKLSKQTGYNSGAEVQIPYLLILISALLMIYNEKLNSTRLIFIDEPFAKMDPGNVKVMLDFMRSQNLQILFCSPDKTESIGNECEVILPVLKVKPDLMQLGIVQFHEEKSQPQEGKFRRRTEPTAYGGL